VGHGWHNLRQLVFRGRSKAQVILVVSLRDVMEPRRVASMPTATEQKPSAKFKRAMKQILSVDKKELQ